MSIASSDASKSNSTRTVGVGVAPASSRFSEGPKPGNTASEPTGIATVVTVARPTEVDEIGVPTTPIKTGEHRRPCGWLKMPKDPSLKHL